MEHEACYCLKDRNLASLRSETAACGPPQTRAHQGPTCSYGRHLARALPASVYAELAHASVLAAAYVRLAHAVTPRRLDHLPLPPPACSCGTLTPLVAPPFPPIESS